MVGNPAPSARLSTELFLKTIKVTSPAIIEAIAGVCAIEPHYVDLIVQDPGAGYSCLQARVIFREGNKQNRRLIASHHLFSINLVMNMIKRAGMKQRMNRRHSRGRINVATVE
jgi:hypothetical protein